ncbi:MAG: CopG family transcriptional regulator [Egibacteraceae bacterium]
MNKTSVYLTDDERRHLAWIAKVEQRSQSEVIRAAIARYEPASPNREFELFNSAERGFGFGDSIADMDDDELLQGFGEDGFGE